MGSFSSIYFCIILLVVYRQFELFIYSSTIQEGILTRYRLAVATKVSSVLLSLKSTHVDFG